MKLFALLLYVALWFAAFTGWVMNFCKLIQIGFDPASTFTVEVLLRIIGVPFAILGAIIGYF